MTSPEDLSGWRFLPRNLPEPSAPPIEACRIETTEHGDVYRATDEYVRWFRSTYPNAGGGDRVKRSASLVHLLKDVGGPEMQEKERPKSVLPG